MLITLCGSFVPLWMIPLGVGRRSIKIGLMHPGVTKDIRKLSIKGFGGGMVEGKVFHIQSETAVVAHLDEFVDVVHPCRCPIRRHSHHFILSFIDLESQEGCERRI